MHQQKYRSRNGFRTHRNPVFLLSVYKKTLFIAAWVLPLLHSGSATAQWNGSKSQFFQKNGLKHYVITPIENKDEYFTAGTIYSLDLATIPTIIQVSNGVHWMYFDNTGNTIMSKVIDDQACNENVVGAHIFNENRVIVAGRFSSGRQTASGLEILTVDNAGNFVSGKVFNSNDASWQSMFPLHSLKYNDRYLFICGYMTNDQPGTSPHLGSNKRGFVLKYDIDGQAVADAIYTDAGGPQGSPLCDIDIVARMKKVSDGIWVGGSVNDGPMMNMVIDPNTMAIVYNESFGIPIRNAGDYESSFDIMETGNGDKFVFGNTHFIDGTTELIPRPGRVHINALQANFMPYGANNRWEAKATDHNWGNCILPDDGGDENTVVLSGFASGRTCGNSPLPTSVSNINPFLSKMLVKMNTSGISVTPYYWNTLLSVQGTGPWTLSNSYYKLGRFIGNLAFAPATATRDLNMTTDLLLTAPVWNTSNRLNMKLVRTDRDGTMQDCPWSHGCDVEGSIWSTSRGTAPGTGPFSVAESIGFFEYYDLPPDYIDDCNGRYRSTAVDPVVINKRNVSVTITPNPAHDFIQVAVQGSFDQETVVTVTLTDIAGRPVADLYNGKQTGLSKKRLALPSVARGPYLVIVSSNERRLKAEKIEIR